ncbi:unnamed protein product, partial [Scytosiphon promiscuus]
MAAATESEVAGSLSKIGEDPSDRDFIAKCVSLCQRFSLTSGDLADHWESFAVNHDGSKAGMASWAGFEAEVAKSKAVATPTAATVAGAATPSSSRSRSTSASIVTPRPAGRRVVNTVTADDLSSSGTKRAMSSFSSPDPKARIKAARQDGESGGELSPTSVQSPPDLVRAVYSARKNAGQKTTSYNPELGLRGKSVPPSTRKAGTRCDIRVDEAVGAPARYRYMYTPLEERAGALEKGLLSLQGQMESRFGLAEVTPVGVPRQEQVVAVGRVCCESTEGKINRASILLE